MHTEAARNRMTKVFDCFNDFCAEFGSILNKRTDLDVIHQQVYAAVHDIFNPWNHEVILTQTGKIFDAEMVKICDNIVPPVTQMLAGVILPHPQETNPNYVFQFDFPGSDPRYMTVIIDKTKLKPFAAHFTSNKLKS